MQKTRIKRDTIEKHVSKQTTHKFFILSTIFLVVLTTSIYYQSLNNNFTNWDDELYVTTNPTIRTLHGDSISYTLKKAFSSYVVGNYHPITMLTYSVEYNLFKLNPKPYHVTNLILHILNTLLVLWFIWLLTKQRWTAFITALLFAIHPMHVESVAWVSERKDMLYAFFSLAALCFYLKYSDNQKLKLLNYVFSLLLFVLAVLSKAMAVCIPLVFFLIDYFKNRRISLNTILEKTPFLLISIVFGIIAIEAQRSLGAIDVVSYNLLEKILISSYGVLMYLWKFLIPSGLTCYYNYPIRQNGIYPVIFYIAPFLIITLLFAVYFSLRKGKDVFFGAGFFLITIVLVLQILPVGGTIISDRYTYIQYIGLFFIVARIINNVLEKKSARLRGITIPLLIVFITVAMVYSYTAYQRTKVWKDSITLWTDAINKYGKEPLPYEFRGNANFKKGFYEKAISDYSTYIFYKNDKASVYNDRGVCYLEVKKYQEALGDFNAAIRYDPKFADTYYYRGAVYNDLGKFDEAIRDYNSAIKLKPDYPKAYFNRSGAYFHIHRYQNALSDALQAEKLGYPVDPLYIDAINEGMTRTVVQK